MDKVIIDGVDVSGCEHYRAEIETKMPYGDYEILKDKCHYSGIEIIQDCKGNKGCIYKQLKRLQAENEKLKTDIAIYKGIIDSDKEKNRAKKMGKRGVGMKPKLNVNFNMNIATLVFSDGYAVTMTYNEFKEVYKLLKDTFEDLQE